MFYTALIFFFITLFSTETGCRQSKSQVGKIPAEYVNWKPVKYAYSESGMEDKGFNIENILPEGYVRDASEDYTKYIQLALNKYNDLVFPDFPLLVSDEGLKIKSNRTIRFLPGSELRLKPSSKANYQIVFINKASNVTLYDPVITGDRDTHLGMKGEWGMGLRISSSENVTVYNPKVSKCWGDGIYISGNAEKGVPRDITIVNAYLKNNRRNGISVISVDGLRLENLYSGFNGGTAPMCGIDIEPDGFKDEIKNIVINNAKTEHNGGTGISVGLNKLYGNGDKDVSIQLNNPVDYGSYNGFLVSCTKSKSHNGEQIKGKISIENPLWKHNEKEAFSIFKLGEPALRLVLSNPAVTSPEGRKMSRQAFLETVNKRLSKNASFQLK